MTAPAPIPGTIAVLEAELVGALAAAFPTLDVRSCPDEVGKYRFTHRHGALLVHYVGSDYGRIAATGVVVQDRDPSWTVNILSRSLAAHVGAYPLLDGVRGVLTGVRLSGAAGPLHPTQEGLVGESDGVWHYAITFKCRAVLVQTAAPDLLPLLTRIRVLSADGAPEAEITATGITHP